MEVEYMFIVENAEEIMTEEFNNFPEITDWSDDSYNILEASLFFNEDLNKIVKATAVAEVMAYNEGTIESFNEGAFETVKNKLAELWRKFKVFVLKVRDRFMAWIRKTFMSNKSFWSKYGNVIEGNASKLLRKNPKITTFDYKSYDTENEKLKNLKLDVGVFKGCKTKDDAIDKFDELNESLDYIKKDISQALNKSEEHTVKDFLSYNKISLNKTVFKDQENKFKTSIKIIENIVKAEEDKVKKRSKSTYTYGNDNLKGSEGNNSSDTALMIYSAKYFKAVCSARLDFEIKYSKMILKTLTKIGYEAVKLQNTKEEDIKEESASIDLLNKYLQRI
jgi:hypothetical protein